MEEAGELVFVPTPGMGHLLATVEAAQLIIRHNHRISAAIFLFNLDLDTSVTTTIRTYIDSKSRELAAESTAGGRLTFVSLPALTVPPDTSSKTFFSDLIELHKPVVKQAVLDRVDSGSPKPVGFVLDMFCTPMMDVTAELHVASYVIFTSGASLLNVMFSVQSMVEDGVVDVYNDSEEEIEIPGFRNKVPRKVFPMGLLEEGGRSEMFLNLARKFRESDGILVNTYEELEPYATQALLRLAAGEGIGKIPAVYPVGPILELDSKSRSGGTQQDESDHSVIEWLDQQPSSSVVFLCFGSMGSFDGEQVKEIADGLDRAGQRFLWSLRKPPPLGKFEMPSQQETFLEVLPEGFLERTAPRGKIIGWAPQVAILAHPAIGGFVSHCGWNSILESMWFGVPIATWPMHAEQQLNAFELVHELGLAVEIKIDYQRDWRSQRSIFMVMAEEIENGVKKLMSIDDEMREKLKEMSNKARKALKEGGSSYYWLDRFVINLLSNVV